MSKVQVDYTPPQKDPLKEDRSATDRVCAFIGAFIFIAWIILSCHALVSGKSEESSGDTKNEEEFKKMLHAQAVLLVPSVVITGIMTLVSFYLISCIPKFCAGATMVISVLGMIVCCLGIIAKLFNLQPPVQATNEEQMEQIQIEMPSIPSLVFRGLEALAIFISLRLVDFDNIAEFIKKSFRAVLNSPSMIPFSLCIVFLQIFVVGLSVISSFEALSGKMDFSGSKIFILLAGVYIYLGLFVFHWMVVSQSLTSWHYADSNNVSSSSGVLRSSGIVFRYHIGSVAFAAIPLVPFILSICKAITTSYPKKTGPRSILVEVFWFIALILTAPMYACTLIAACGKNLSESTEKVWAVMTRKSIFSWALTHVVGISLGLGAIISFLLSLIAMPLFTVHITYAFVWILLVIASFMTTVLPSVVITQFFSLEKDLESENENGPGYNMKV